MNSTLAKLLFPACLLALCAACSPREPEWVSSSGETARVDLAAAAQADSRPGGGPVPVETAQVSVTDLETAITASGNILPWESLVLSAKMPGKVKAAPAEEGGAVAKGDLIAELETEDLSIELARARSEAGRARARYKRVKSLYDEAAATITQLESAESADKAASSALSSLEERLGSARVTAPFAGLLSRKMAMPGTVVNAGQPLAELVDVSKVKIEAAFSEVEAKHAEKGRKSQILVDAYPDRKFEGEVSYVGAVVDPLTRTFPVRIAIDNSGRLLKAGMSARVRIVTGSFPGALTVPAGALVKEGAKTFVFTVSGGGEAAFARKLEVEAGLPDGGVVQVRAGLTKEDTVAVRGVEKLADGARVRIVNVNN